MNILIIILFVVSAFADCQIQDNGQVRLIKENDSISLFEKGKSLATHKIQDQDGLGTCYANAASVVLKSTLSGNPDISYLHLGMEASTNGKSPRYKEGGKYVVNQNNQEVDNVASYGNVCDAFNAAQKAGGACPAGMSILENQQEIDPLLQNQLFLRLGKYFDNLNEAKKDPSKFSEFEKQLSRAMEEFHFKRSELIKACEADRPNIPLKRAFINILGTEFLKLDPNDKCDLAQINRIRAINTEAAYFGNDRVKIDLAPSVIKKLNMMVEGQVINDATSADQIEYFINYILPRVPAECEKTHHSFKTSKQVMKDFYDYQMKEQSKFDCRSYVDDSDAAEDVNSCYANTSLEPFLKTLKPLIEIGKLSEPSILGQLTDPRSKFADQMKKIIFPGCLEKNNLISLEKLNCSTFRMCDLNGGYDADNSVYKGPAGGCLNFEDGKNMMRSRVLGGISANRAMGINVCTGFMKDPDVRTSYCVKPAKGIEGHGFHAMTISGLRCINNKIEYEVVNSWGVSDCPVPEKKSESKYKNSAIECILDEKKYPTGKFWVKEDVLVDNTTGVVEIAPKAGK